ncbi:MAG: hypothetical protein J0L62_13230 [Bacteroidetes bacterium]|nr:hypothetical protein [Bacteroidota bacterium]
MRFLFGFIVFFISNLSFSQSTEVDLFIKGNQKVVFNVKTVHSGGLQGDSKTFANFKIIDSLYVRNDSLLASIEALLDNETIIRHQNYVTVNLTTCRFQVHIPDENNGFSNSSFGVSFSTIQGTLLGFHLDSELKNFENLIIRLDFSTGFYNKTNPFLSSLNLGAALGYQFQVFMKPEFYVGYGLFSGNSTDTKSILRTRPYLISAVNWDFEEVEWVEINGGISVYPNPIIFKKQSDYFSLFIGLNFKI